MEKYFTANICECVTDCMNICTDGTGVEKSVYGVYISEYKITPALGI